MLYGIIYRRPERNHFWSFKFKSKKVLQETQQKLFEIRDKKVSKYKYRWPWKRWTLESIQISEIKKDLRPFVKDSSYCETPEDLINRIENIHNFWDSHIP